MLNSLAPLVSFATEKMTWPFVQKTERKGMKMMFLKLMIINDRDHDHDDRALMIKAGQSVMIINDH